MERVRVGTCRVEKLMSTGTLQRVRIAVVFCGALSESLART
jgi:hypothetical protein